MFLIGRIDTSREKLQRGLPTEAGILSKPYLPHPTSTELFEDLIMTYLLILHNAGILHEIAVEDEVKIEIKWRDPFSPLIQ
ncbi:hypothetical protein ACFL3H_07335 [Gemmatimonadota bacterium]